MSLLGIDIGSSSAKACAYSRSGLLLASHSRGYTMISPRPGWAELDPRRVWEAIATCIREASREASERGDPPRALAVSSPGEVFTLVDSAFDPVYNTILTMDRRAVPEIEAVARAAPREVIRRTTGVSLQPRFPVPKLLWFKRNMPEVWSRAARALSWTELVMVRLGLPPTIDLSLAGRTMALDVRRRAWADGLLSELGLSSRVFGELVPSGRKVGVVSDEAARSLGLPLGVVAVSGGFDQFCAALGVGVAAPPLASLGMGSIECLTVPVAAADLEKVLEGVAAECEYPVSPYVAGDGYAFTASCRTGSALIDWYARTLGAPSGDSASLLAGAATEPDPCLFFVPHIWGGGPPHNDPSSVGCILGLRNETRQSNIARAMIEGLSFELRANVEAAGRILQVREVRASGGGSRCRLWLEVTATVLGMPITPSAQRDASPVGAAILAGCGAGVFAGLEEAVSSLARLGEPTRPNAGCVALYDEMFQTYEVLYAALAPYRERIAPHRA